MIDTDRLLNKNISPYNSHYKWFIALKRFVRTQYKVVLSKIFACLFFYCRLLNEKTYLTLNLALQMFLFVQLLQPNKI